MNTFDQYVNETLNMLNERSINKINKEFSEVVVKMAELAKEYSAAEGDTKAKILAELKELTAKKKALTNEMDDAVAGKDRNVQLVIKESEVTESYGKPAGLTKDETMEVAQKFADAMSKADSTKVTVNKRTLEEDSFDLDVDGEEFAGGSYNIYQNGNVMNMAIRSNPVYGKKNDSVDTIAKNIKKMSESSVTEGKGFKITQKTIDDIESSGNIDIAYKKAMKLLKSMLTKNITQKTIDDIESSGNIDIAYNKAIKLLKSMIGEIKPVNEEEKSFTDYNNKELAAYCKNNPTDKKAAAELHKRAQNLKNLTRTDEAKDNIKVGDKENIGEDLGVGLQDWWESNVAESAITEGKKFYNTKEIVKISNAAGDIVVDAKYAIQDLSVAYGDKVPAKELDKVLTNYDLEIEDLTESIVNEGKKVTLKRRYTENYPAVTAGKDARIRNKVLEAIKDGKITQEEFDKIVSELSNDSKRWTKNNAQYFTISEEGVSLSKFGQKILKSITVNEATTKNPEIWVPGGFDKELSKIPNQKIDMTVVSKLARKYEVDLDDAIKYVEFGWMIDLNENNNNMKTKFIYESFSEFVNSLNESTETLNEAFASAKLASILTGANKMDKDLPQAFYSMSKIALDKIQDVDIIEMTPEQAKKEKRANAVYLYFTTNEKDNPYAGSESYGVSKIPGNTLLAITDGSNEWMATEWQRSYSRSKKATRVLKTTKRDDSAGFPKSGARAQYGSGISSMKQVVELADRAYCLDLDILRARYSTTAQRDERAAAKKGAIAFKNDKDFKQENLNRYHTIIANRAAAMPIDKMVADAIDTLSAQIKDALAKGEKTRYNEILLGTSSKGREAKLQDAANHMQRILDDFQRYVSYTNQAEEEKKSGYGGDFYTREVKNYAKSITDRIKQIETFGYAW